MSDKELFSFVPAKGDESEIISAPLYSYWKSVTQIPFFKTRNCHACFIDCFTLDEFHTTNFFRLYSY